MPPNARTKRIFIAEDDRNLLELLTTRLGLAGYETSFGRDGWEALEGIHSTRPAAIVLDVNMPRLDGFGVLRHLRKSPGRGQHPSDDAYGPQCTKRHSRSPRSRCKRLSRQAVQRRDVVGAGSSPAAP